MTSSTWGASFESAGVDAMQVYDDVLVPRLFTPWACLLLDELDVAKGEAVLDVACGPGSVTRLAAAAAGPRGRVTGCDLSQAMLAIAQSKPAAATSAPIDYHEAPADRLPLADAGYDVAVCQQGLQFFADRAGALAEMRRALRPNGRIGIAVWSAIEETPVLAALEATIREVLGDQLADRYRGGPWGMPRGEDIGDLLEAAGFTAVRVTHRTLPLTFDADPSQLTSTLAASGIATDLEHVSPDVRTRLAETLERNVSKLVIDASIQSEAASHLAFAVR
ncbi:MAG TPA: methyltransferase domain-containing protein [Gaiellaceae bacterium]|nr:methyltransferase domain-containing protein [Gaiellaceae bacterium]